MQKAEQKKSFIIYNNYLKYFYLLSREERGDLITAMLEYANNADTTVELEGAARMAFAVIQDTMDRDMEQYSESCRKNSENGKRGGRPKKEENSDNKEQSKKPTAFFDTPKKPTAFSDDNEKPKKADNDNDNENDNENKNDNDNGNGNENGNENDNEQCEAGNSAPQSCASASPREDAPLDSRCSASRSARDAPLTDREINNLIFEGLTPEYIDERQERAREYAAKSGRSAYDILVGWWKLDTRSAKPSDKGKKRDDKALNDDDEWFERRCQLIFDGKNNSQGDGS
ncbi:MAG: hypothetical protein IJY04_11075 [Clostridia bacterium]|nr:hypothetical protein [Clostridia bacterium]